MRQFVGYKDEVVGAVDAEISWRGQEFGDDLKSLVPAHAPDFSGCEIRHVHVAPAVEIYSAKILETVGKESIGEELRHHAFRRDFRNFPLLPTDRDDLT
ncbi:MAG: hypothetical protein JW395_1044 [Nitrospira sp.]|nr:hypothetical protein [Nitrospira sp.]